MNIEQIKRMTRHDWTDELINEAIESLKEINPTLEIIQIVINCDRPEVVVRGVFNGRQAVFQAPMIAFANCVVENLSLTELYAKTITDRENEKKKLIDIEKAKSKVLAEANKKTKQNQTTLVINTLVDNFIKAVQGEDETGLTYHVSRCKSVRCVNQVLIAGTVGQYVTIGREGCFLPQTLDLTYKNGVGWKARSKDTAELIATTWNNRLEEMLAVLR